MVFMVGAMNNLSKLGL